jgi:large subunit ribosomal protein L29
MKIKELRSKSIEELRKDLAAFKKELFNLRFQKVQGQADKTHRVKQVRRAVARVKTLLQEMVLGIKKQDKKIKKPVIKKEIKKEVAPKKDAKKETEVKAEVKKKAEPKDKKQKIIKDKKNA